MFKIFYCVCILSLALPLSSRAYSRDTTIVSIAQDGSQIGFERVIQTPNESKETLYKRAKEWVINNLKTVDQNVGNNDADFQINNAGVQTIDPKTNSISVFISEGRFNFKIQVQFKEGRYKLKIDNIEIYTVQNDGRQIRTKTRKYSELSDNKEGKYIRAQIDQKLTELVRSFNDYVLGTTAEKNW